MRQITLGLKLLLNAALSLMLCSVATGQSIARHDPIKIVFVGDIMLDDLPGQYIQDGKDPFASFTSLFKSADLTIGNLECVVGITGTKEDKPFVLRAHPRVLPTLKKHFSALSLANNHSGDYGPEAFSAMLDLLDEAGIQYFGGGKNAKF
jgi:poly-gamma-glutamate capsule biosynthesis protein CapA/YwtB (metallophosphatase superfamily)